MEGVLLSVNRQEKRGRVDTRNVKYGVLTLYFSNSIPAEIKKNCTISFEIKKSAIGNIYAKFSAIVERNTAVFNTEDRSLWYVRGEDFEAAFINRIVPRLKLEIRKNPEKAVRPWAIDLYDYSNNRPADLKVQNTPFFTAGKYKYGAVYYDPQYTVTFNKKDYEYYAAHYQGCDIYFWVNWDQLEYKNIHVSKLAGVWRASFSTMARKIENGEVALHAYLHRTNDDHNAKDSFLFMLDDKSVFEKLL